MSIIDLLILGAFVALLIGLLRANSILGRNPQERIKQHESQLGQFPPNTNLSDKIRLINLFGIAPTDPNRVWVLIAVVIAFFFLQLWLS
ncbi:MAG: hypothetical protein Q7K57_07370 [Burkholderiaceae bacterium]|nr:hypothetical protein [Burkholderiaceae bacterium]